MKKIIVLLIISVLVMLNGKRVSAVADLNNGGNFVINHVAYQGDLVRLDYGYIYTPRGTGLNLITGGKINRLQAYNNSDFYLAGGEVLVANGDVQMNLAAIKSGSNFSVFFPASADNSRTTVSLPYVAGVTAETEKPDAARKLLAFLLSDEAQKAVIAVASGRPVREAIAAQMDAENDPLSPAGLLNGVTLWVPDWNEVAADLDADIAEYNKAVGG